MKVTDGSLSYRGAVWAFAWLSMAARCSLVGRFFISCSRFLRVAGGDSVVFGLDRERSRPLGRTGHPQTVLALSRPYLWLRGRLPSVSRPVSTHFGRSGWLLVVGAGIFAFGWGSLAGSLTRALSGTGLGSSAGLESSARQVALGYLLAVLVVVIGAFAFAAASNPGRALRHSGVARGGRWLGWSLVEGREAGFGGAAATAAAPEADRRQAGPPAVPHRRSRVLWMAVGLALLAGALLGLLPGAEGVVAVVALVGVFALILFFRRPEIMLLAVAAFPWLDWVARGTLGPFGPAWDDALLLLSFALLVWAAVVLRTSILWTVPILLPMLLAFVVAVASVVVRGVPGDVAIFALRVVFQPLLFFFVGFLLPKNKRWVQWTVALFLLSGVALALHGLFQYVTNAPMPASWVDVRETEIATRAYSVIENPNGLAAFLLIGSLLSLGLALERRLPPLQRWVMAAACVVHVVGVAVTFSRGAWLGLIVGVIALFVLHYRRYLALLAVGGGVLWFAAPAQFTNRLTFAFSADYISKSLVAGRLYVWGEALKNVGTNPFFGLGLGTWGGSAAVRFGYGRLWVDNFYLQLAAEGGFILLILFLWILLRGGKGLVRAHGRSSDPYLCSLAAGMFGAFMAVVVANLTASVWETLVVGAGFWFMTGLVTSAVLHVEAPEGGEPG